MPLIRWTLFTALVTLAFAALEPRAVEAQVSGRGAIEIVIPRILEAPPVIRLDGEPLPAGSLRSTGVTAGPHTIDADVPGYLPFHAEVEVVARQTTVVTLQLVRPATPFRIRCDTPGARIVFLEHEHTPPLEMPDLPVGSYEVRVAADGYRTQSFTCSTDPEAAPSEGCDRDVVLEEIAAPLHVRLAVTTPGPASVLVDGARVGDAPYEGSLRPGTHTIEVTHPGWEPHRETVEVDAEGTTPIDVEAILVDPVARARERMVTHAASTIAPMAIVLDLSLGWPHLGEVRAGLGLHEWVDVGVAIRSFGRLTELEARARFGIHVLEFLAVGGQLRIGGGFGPPLSHTAPDYAHDPRVIDAGARQDIVPQDFGAAAMRQGPVTNTFYGSLEATASYHLESIAAFSLWLGLDVSSDEYAGHPRSDRYYLDFGPGGLQDPICPATGELRCARQEMARFRMGVAAEVILTPLLNLWIVLEGIPGQGSDYRRLYSAVFTDAADIRFYPRVGVTLKL